MNLRNLQCNYDGTWKTVACFDGDSPKENAAAHAAAELLGPMNGVKWRIAHIDRFKPALEFWDLATGWRKGR